MTGSAHNEKKGVVESQENACGIVMPISAIDGCDESHWTEVLQIISDSALSAGLEPNLVSNSDEVGIIQKRIIQNLYENPIVVCDVSGKNANVMFELGLRLAFDKAVVIVKDDRTSYSFDTSPIEHLTYPRDLRFSKIVDFKKRLAAKLQATLAQVRSDPNFSPFIKHFGSFQVVKLSKEEVPAQEFILSELRSIKAQISSQSLQSNKTYRDNEGIIFGERGICMKGVPENDIRRAVDVIKSRQPGISIDLEKIGSNHFHVSLDAESNSESYIQQARSYLNQIRRSSRNARLTSDKHAIASESETK